jgi:hypothetical protein
MKAVAQACVAVTLASSGSGSGASSTSSSAATLYDCQGRVPALASAGTQKSAS